MSCSINLHPDNSLTFELVLTNPKVSPVYVNDATVEVTVYDPSGVEVTGQVWPLSLSYVTDSDGVYRATTDPISGITAGVVYKIVTSAVGSDDTEATWTDYSKATTRECG